MTNTIGLLAMFNNLDRDCLINSYKSNQPLSKCRQLPQPSTTLNIELLAPAEAGAEFRVRIRLNDEYLNIREDKTKSVDEKGFLFSEFKAIVLKNVAMDWYKKCDIGYENQAEQIQEYDTKTLYFIYLITGFDGCLLLLVLLVLLRSFVTRKSQKTLDQLRRSNLSNYGYSVPKSQSYLQESMLSQDRTPRESFYQKGGNILTEDLLGSPKSNTSDHEINSNHTRSTDRGSQFQSYKRTRKPEQEY